MDVPIVRVQCNEVNKVYTRTLHINFWFTYKLGKERNCTKRKNIEKNQQKNGKFPGTRYPS